MRTLLSDVARCNGYIADKFFPASTPMRCELRGKCLRYLTPPNNPKRDVYMLPDSEPCALFMEIEESNTKGT